MLWLPRSAAVRPLSARFEADADVGLGPKPTFAMCECCAAAFPEAVVRRVAQKFVCPMLRIRDAVAFCGACTLILALDAQINAAKARTEHDRRRQRRRPRPFVVDDFSKRAFSPAL